MNTNKSLADVEIKECVGSYNFSVRVEADTETLTALENSPFIISLKATILQGKKVLGIGRANSILSPKNKYIKNAVIYCFNAAIVDGFSKAVKILDNLPIKADDQKESLDEEPDLEGRDRQAYFTNNDDLKYASDKQRNFLKKLVSKCDSSSKREYENKLQSPYLSSFECSALIKNLLTK
jgi:hypothetical protein